MMNWLRPLAVALAFAFAASAFAGCSDKGKSADGESKGAAKAASKSSAQKLVGKWGIDTEALKSSKKFKDMPEDQKKMALAMMEGMMGSATFEFTKDAVKITMMGKTQEAKYSVTKEDGKSLVLSSEKDGKKETINITFKSDDSIAMKGDDNEEIVLKRKK